MSRVPAGSMPVSAIRFPKSRKNFFLPNFYFLLSPVLLIADVFHPLDHFAVEVFLNGDMSHCGRRRRAVPMLRMLWRLLQESPRPVILVI